MRGGMEWTPKSSKKFHSPDSFHHPRSGMVERVFLGWDEPFLTKAVGWLLARRDDLPTMIVVVPTAQSGRRLREALAQAGGALLSPRVATPGSFLQSRDDEAAPKWIERAAWMEVMENVTDWSTYQALFPEVPGEGRDWAGGLAQEMAGLRQTLQENGLLLSTAAWKLKGTVEAERWEAMGRLEDLVEKQLKAWGEKSRSRLLLEGLLLPSGISTIVLAGVPEIPPVLRSSLITWGLPVTCLIGAPDHEGENFSEFGTPAASWSERHLPLPNGRMEVVADPRQQAAEALRVVGEMQTTPDQVVLGSADTEVGDELARAFTREGWIAFHPAAALVNGGLPRWFKLWGKWMTDPTLSAMADLLTLPETSILAGGKRGQKSRTLAELRDRWMLIRTEDLRRRIAAETFRRDEDKAAAMDLLEGAEKLESWRTSLLSKDFPDVLSRMLDFIGKTNKADGEMAGHMIDWIANAAPLMERLDRGPGFWIDLMVSEAPTHAPAPPDGRVIDVQGWLELFHEPGSHLVLCGMNEGKVPGRSGGEPWLSEASRDKLGLTKDADRAARDAYLYQAMIEARREGGRVDAICGKSGAGGEPLLPSRLLLAAGRHDLPARVTALFKEIEPPEAGMRWEADWIWKPRAVPPTKRINVTSLGDYLACPFRYYLKYGLNMQTPEPGRAEWNARDFGTVAHDILENWGRDTDARESDDPKAIHDWLSSALDETAARWFGKRIPLSVRIQMESLRQRFVWLARVQAKNRSDGWKIVDVERKVELPVGEAHIVAKIDRIDLHESTGKYRVIDYKTGKVDSVDKAHRRKISPNTVLPEHLALDCPAIYAGESNGKSASFLWQNLQLPLYAAALVLRDFPLPTPCYFTLRSTESEVAIHEWTDFETADLDAARECADWVAGQIAAGVFWPPAEKVTYDDFAVLSAGRAFTDMFVPPQEPPVVG